MKRILLEGPAVEPLLLAEAKAHLRLDADDEDELLGALIVAARVALETEIRRVLIAQRWRAIVDGPPRGRIALPVVPVLSVEAVRGVDGDGNTTELDESDYSVDAADGSVTFAAEEGAVRHEIDFTAGYGSSGVDVPQPLRQAIRLLVTHWYEHRAAAADGDAMTEAPFGFRALIAPYRRISLC
jgi:uncharacterized phiE125 gp8 family phage protein